MSDLSMLLDMGFSQFKAEMALEITGNKGVEPAMEWLLAHADEIEPANTNPEPESVPEAFEISMDDETQPAEAVTATSEEGDTKAVEEEMSDLSQVAKSLQCNDCQKRFRTDSEVEFHAVKTGHQNFSESSEEVKPLSEEEKKEQLKKVETIIKQRRAEKAEQDKREALEREKNRRKTGQELTHVRQKMQEEEIKQLAELKRREKLEEKMARQRVLEEIERDKQARREKFGGASAAPATPVVSVPVKEKTTPNPEAYEECRIQIRLTNGECLTHTFSPKEELAAVRLYVSMNRTDGAEPFTFMTNFPKKVFSEDDMKCPLFSLGLVPAAVLIVVRPQ